MFDTLANPARRKVALGVSIGVHVLVGAVLVVPPLLATQDPPTPEDRFAAVYQPPRPPDEPIRVELIRHPVPKGDPGGGTPGTSQRVRKGVEQPREIPGVLPDPPTAGDEDVSLIEGRVDVDDGPLTDGPGSNRGRPFGDPEGGGTLVPGPGVSEPVALSTPSPKYPDAARWARKEGIVLLEAVIGADGRVRDVRVTKSLDPLLDRAAAEAVLAWRYEPARVNGRAVAVFLSVKVGFRLR